MATETSKREHKAETIDRLMDMVHKGGGIMVREALSAAYESGFTVGFETGAHL